MHYKGLPTDATSRIALNRFSDRRLQGQVTTATPFPSRDGSKDKEPFEHLQLTPASYVRQALSGVYVWRLESCLMRVFCLRHDKTA